MNDSLSTDSGSTGGPPAGAAAAPAPAARLVALDRLRGLVMVLMVSDHAAKVFYADFFQADGAMMWRAGTTIPVAAFLHRWLSHLCAPTFLFLAGAGLALSRQRRLRRGVPDGITNDVQLALRGALLVVLELTWIRMLWGGEFGGTLLQVLWAIGASMVLMAVFGLRRLDPRIQAALGCAVIVGNEWITDVVGRSWWTTLVFDAGFVRVGLLGPTLVVYPVVPWLGIMLLGAGYGAWLAGVADDGVRGHRVAAARTALLGLAALVVFVPVRGLGGYGNEALQIEWWRDDTLVQHVVQWLHVSKYPPSVAFVLLELGLGLVLLAGLLALDARRIERDPRARPWRDPLLLVGAAPLLFYLLHIGMLEWSQGAVDSLWAVVGARSPRLGQGGIGWTWGIVVAVTALLVPVCALWAGLRRRYPRNPLLRML